MKQVDIPSVQGSFGILPKHVPAIATLKPGVLTVFEESDIKKFFGESSIIASNLTAHGNEEPAWATYQLMLTVNELCVYLMFCK